MWQKIKAQFYNSETILWARIQLVAGAVWAVLVSTDLSTVVSSKYLTYWLIFSGVVTELLRKRGTTINDAGNLVSKT